MSAPTTPREKRSPRMCERAHHAQGAFRVGSGDRNDPETALRGEEAAHTLQAQGVCLAYGPAEVVHNLTLTIPTGTMTAIVGPNACGKSTLLRALARLHQPSAGVVLLDGQDIATRPTREVARKLGILPQSPVAPEGLTVAALVARGRYPHRRLLSGWSAADDRAVEHALAQTGMSELAARDVDQLSGGQRQRAWIAMALAQQTDILLLDEPTTFLDLPHQLEVLELVARLRAQRGVTVVMVLHDLNLAARYAEHLVAMAAGRVVAQGEPATVVTQQLMAQVFALDCLVIPDPVTGGPLVVPRGALGTRPVPDVAGAAVDGGTAADLSAAPSAVPDAGASQTLSRRATHLAATAHGGASHVETPRPETPHGATLHAEMPRPETPHAVAPRPETPCRLTSHPETPRVETPRETPHAVASHPETPHGVTSLPETPHGATLHPETPHAVAPHPDGPHAVAPHASAARREVTS